MADNNNKLKKSYQKGRKPSGSQDRKFTGIILPVLSVIIVIIMVIGGSFYVIMHYNINNLGEKYRTSLQDISLLSWVLPEPSDPDDPANMPAFEVREKYSGLVNRNKSLEDELKQANKTLSELEKYKSENEKNKKELEQKREKLDRDIKEFNEMVVSEDKKGFIEYYEEINENAAKELYKNAVKESENEERLKAIADIYENMDAEEAALVLEEMSLEKVDFIVGLLVEMEDKTAAKIMESMDKRFASLITDAMYTLNQNQ